MTDEESPARQKRREELNGWTDNKLRRALPPGFEGDRAAFIEEILRNEEAAAIARLSSINAGPPEKEEPAPAEGEVTVDMGAQPEPELVPPDLSESEPGAADAVAAADEFLRLQAKKKREREAQPPPAIEQQSSLLDIVVEDPELEDKLETIFEKEAKAKALTGEVKVARTESREIIKGRYKYAINSDDDGEHSGYMIVGRFRIRPRTGVKEELTKEITQHAGVTWEDFEIEQVGTLPLK